MKAIILAAGPGPNTKKRNAQSPWVLQPLGDRRILDYVVDLARATVDAADIYIVVDKAESEIITYLGSDYTYVVQARPLGTGHAVMQVETHLQGYDRNLLILYGDKPFFRRSSILGLIQRHRLTDANLTLLTGVTDEPLPYGRVIREPGGCITDVVEAAVATPAEQQITELYIGAYVVSAPRLWPALREVAAQTPERIPFTSCVRHLMTRDAAQKAGVIESYRVLDPDEVLGINTQRDLEQAALILQKRQLRPRRIEEHNIIRFGTGGWRALIGEGFTLDNVRRLCQALANDIVRQNREKDGVLIGFDRRFLADVAGQVAAEVFAGNNIPVQLLTEDAPTPLVTYATAKQNVGYGLMFTASHNPPQWNGLKVFASDGSLPLDDETKRMEEEANQIDAASVVKVDFATALNSGLVCEVDYTNEYVDAVEALIDLQAIRNASLRVLVDPMYGVGQNTLEIILTEARCRVSTIHTGRDPLFGGRSPAPDLASLSRLINMMGDGEYDLGLAMDGDADRIAIVDRTGRYISTNELLVLLYFYLHEVRGERGGVTRNIATTHLLDRLAAHLGENCYEVPVGFKHIASSMKEHDVLLAGESSGGLSIRGHILGKDGIFACALVVEMMACTGRTIVDMLEQVYAITGKLVSREVNLAATPDMKVIVPHKLAETAPTEIAGYPVTSVSNLDGTKFYLENDNWLLLRFSGTEPLLRIFAEADSDEKVDALVAWAQSLINA